MSKFSFTKLVVGNLDAMQDFYTQVFELEETHRIKRVDLEEVVLRSHRRRARLAGVDQFRRWQRGPEW